MEQQEDRPRERATRGRIRSRFFMGLEKLEKAAAGSGGEAKGHQTGGGKELDHGAVMLESRSAVAMKKTVAISLKSGLFQ
jgi:hypothetical protein